MDIVAGIIKLQQTTNWNIIFYYYYYYYYYYY